jgi:hypothetical protein
MTALDTIHAGLIIGLSREMARRLDRPVGDSVCRHAAWYIANGGFGLSLEQIGEAANVSKQAVSEGCARIADKCDDRQLERIIIAVADTFGVSL